MQPPTRPTRRQQRDDELGRTRQARRRPFATLSNRRHGRIRAATPRQPSSRGHGRIRTATPLVPASVAPTGAEGKLPGVMIYRGFTARWRARSQA